MRRGSNNLIGRQGEEIAFSYLQNRKYAVVERNFRCKCGEVDIIARDGKTIVFVEVKTRRATSFGPPQLSVTEFKQRQISKSALTYLALKGLSQANARFDVIAIFLQEKNPPLIEHIQNAFDLKY
jgi:putative endonuclease